MDLHWRNSQKPARLWVFDARATFVILFALIPFALWKLIPSFSLMFLFLLMERRGLTFEASLRAFRCWLLGAKRPATHRRSFRRWIDYG